MSRERLPSGKRLRILELLAEHGEMTGWDLGEADKTLVSGTIYATLMRLQDDGFVQSRKVPEPGRPGPAPNYYKITAAGSRAVRLAHQFALI